ncbi:MAG: hypothetical protein JST38_11160 [Bacteroidetes bacterium]|nr:hypothetical protein [Bacteroidota bacterium]
MSFGHGPSVAGLSKSRSDRMDMGLACIAVHFYFILAILIILPILSK